VFACFVVVFFIRVLSARSFENSKSRLAHQTDVNNGTGGVKTDKKVTVTAESTPLACVQNVWVL
jgi:hypothetical protein